jgi:hypothetical protein
MYYVYNFNTGTVFYPEDGGSRNLFTKLRIDLSNFNGENREDWNLFGDLSIKIRTILNGSQAEEAA